MSVQTSVNIDKMPVGEKLGLMELLWRDLSREPENIDLPEWHLKKLEEAEKRSLTVRMNLSILKFLKPGFARGSAIET